MVIDMREDIVMSRMTKDDPKETHESDPNQNHSACNPSIVASATTPDPAPESDTTPETLSEP